MEESSSVVWVEFLIWTSFRFRKYRIKSSRFVSTLILWLVICVALVASSWYAHICQALARVLGTTYVVVLHLLVLFNFYSKVRQQPKKTTIPLLMWLGGVIWPGPFDISAVVPRQTRQYTKKIAQFFKSYSIFNIINIYHYNCFKRHEYLYYLIFYILIGVKIV